MKSSLKTYTKLSWFYRQVHQISKIQVIPVPHTLFQIIEKGNTLYETRITSTATLKNVIAKYENYTQNTLTDVNLP